MNKLSYRLMLLSGAALVVACRSDGTLAPPPADESGAPPARSQPPAGRPPASQPAHVHLQVVGTYEMNATVTGFDRAWGDFAGCRTAGVLTFFSSDSIASGPIGLFTDLRFIYPNGESDVISDGSIASYATSTGKPAFELVGDYFHLEVVVDSVSQSGNAAEPERIEGTWSHAHFSGRFTATRVRGG